MATSFKVKFSKSKNQQSVTIVRDDNVDLSAVTSIVSKSYRYGVGTVDNEYTFSAGEVSALIAGTVTVATASLLGSATPDDDFYTISLEGNSAAYVSDNAGVGITLEALYEALKHSGSIDVYSPDYRIDRMLLTSFMLAYEMDNLEIQDPSKQKADDFAVRQERLQKILNYS